MKAEKLFQALGNVQDPYIEQMYAYRSREDRSRARKRPGVFLLVAAILSLLGIAALAAASPASSEKWFYSFFGESAPQDIESALTEHQQQILHSGLAEIGQSVTREGYTITLESGLCDGRRALIKCRVEAPENIILDARKYSLQYSHTIAFSGGVPGNYSASTYHSHFLEDDDPGDNAITVLLDIFIQPPENSGISIADGTVWTITISSIDSLTGSPGNAEWNTLCAGTWEYQVAFEDNLLVTQSQELLSEPVRCGATMFIDNRFVHSKRLPLTAKILSFELRSLTATIRVKRPLIAHFSGVDLEKPIYLILKDGTRIEVTYHQSIYREGYDEVLCLFDRPVSREDVAFIELPGTGRFSAAGEEIR